MPHELTMDAAPPMTVNTPFVRGMLAAVQAKSIAFESWVRDAGISAKSLSSDSSRITLQQYGRLLKVLITALDDEMLGFLGRPLKQGSFALMVKSAVEAQTLETAIRHVAHTFRLLNDDLKLRLVVSGREARVELEFVNSTVGTYPFVHQVMLRVYWRLFVWLTGGRLTLERFEFALPRPTYQDAYVSLFPAALLFNAASTAMWFPRAHLALPIVRDARAARIFLADAPVNVIVPAPDSDLIGAVRTHLRSSQPQWPDLEHTARALSVSASTLQRQLAVQHTSFRSVRDELRCELAIHRLTTSTVAFAKLADELGFADAASFQRAFKRWTRHGPGDYRRLSR